ncbi:MAG: sensor histidine kinase [Halomonas sp.]
MRSIRFRLIVGIGIPFVLLGVLTVVSSQLLLSRQINQTFDGMLHNAAQRLERRIHSVDGELRINMHYFSISTLGSRGEGKIFYRIRDDAGNMLAGFDGLADPPEEATTPTFYDTRFAGNALRAVALTFPVIRDAQRRQIEVIVAESTEARQSVLNDFLVTLTGLIAMGGVLAITIAMIAIHRGLAPLRTISRALRQRSPNDLAPVQAAVPREVSALVSSINGLMARMRQSIENTQQFNADVSHQLRTPVSEIRALAELTARQSSEPATRERLQEIERIAGEAGYTVQQLLTLAKTRHELVEATALTPLALDEVARHACTDRITGIYQRGQELEFEATDADARILGDAIMLRWLIHNLIDNASQHAGGGTPYRGSIRVTVSHEAGCPTLRVCDTGVGVDEAQRARLTERFYRASPHTAGSGLGLAIVDEVSRAHGARLAFERPPGGGLCVSVRFTAPRADAAGSR